MNSRRLFRRIGLGFITVAFACAFVLMVFELLYRVQTVDTYGPELRAYNSTEDLAAANGRPTALLMGDSFTAGADSSYPADLRRQLPGARIVNAAISGTGIMQTEIVARERFARFRPKVFLYQVYVGNDLFDIRYPVNWSRVSALRNLYWLVSNHFRSIAFINYRLGQFRYEISHDRDSVQSGTAPNEPFSVGRYDSRVKAYFQAEPGLVQSSVLLQKDRVRDFAVLLDRLRHVLARCVPGQCAAYVLVIPHCAQVTTTCLQNTRALGATIDDSLAVEGSEYPFVARMRSSLCD
ncbi:MAG TPA: hypothetical protein VIJ16_07590, partial [Gemmatimonadaceae bacterium]